MYVFRDRTLLFAQLRFVAPVSLEVPTGDRQVLRGIALSSQSLQAGLADEDYPVPVRCLFGFVQME